MTTNASVPLRSTIPARLDRLSWSPFHTRMVAGLGAAWILDGLQITIASSVTGVLQQPADAGHDLDRDRPDRLGLPDRRDGRRPGVRADVGPARPQAAADHDPAAVPARHRRWPRSSPATTPAGWCSSTPPGSSPGMGIGGQYAAINSAIDEMMPSKYRGRVDIWINGTYWAGAIIGSFASLIFLNAFADQRRLAAGVPDGPGAGAGRHRRRPHPAGEPALADDPRPRRGGRTRAGQDRGRRAQVGRRARRRSTTARRSAWCPRSSTATCVFLRLVFREYPKRAILGRLADDHPVVPLQRDLLHLRAGAGQLLRRQRHQRAALRPGVLGRQPARPADPRRRCSTPSAASR